MEEKKCYGVEEAISLRELAEDQDSGGNRLFYQAITYF